MEAIKRGVQTERVETKGERLLTIPQAAKEIHITEKTLLYFIGIDCLPIVWQAGEMKVRFDSLKCFWNGTAGVASDKIKGFRLNTEIGEAFLSSNPKK